VDTPSAFTAILGRQTIAMIVNTTSGVEFSDCFGRRVSVELDGVPVQLIGLEDLKKNKKAGGRHKDLNDLENLP
jgi:hypothetical protein